MRNKDSIQLFVATDLHYLSCNLMDDGPAFQRCMEYDGKLTRYSHQILQALVNQTIQNKPDGLILSGDLTFNGEMQSLLEIKDQLSIIQKHGIPVYVIAGNHDIDYMNAREYQGNQSHYVPSVSADEFKNQMKDFGYEQALSKDKDSMSYLAKISKQLVLLMMDCNTRKPKQRCLMKLCSGCINKSNGPKGIICKLSVFPIKMYCHNPYCCQMGF